MRVLRAMTALAAVIAAFTEPTPASAQRATPATLITVEGGSLAAWRAEAGERQPIRRWVSRPFFEAEAEFRPAPWKALKPLLADVDGDGRNELIVLDVFGVAVLGDRPAYHRFPEAATDYNLAMWGALGDVNGDGRSELVTMRRLPTGVDGSLLQPLSSEPIMRRIEIFAFEPAGLKSLYRREFPGRAYAPIVANVNAGPAAEVLTASESILVLEKAAGSDWRVAATLPNIGRRLFAGGQAGALVDVIGAADLNGDGLNEIVGSGNSGMVTVYQYARYPSGDVYPVWWQSPWLGENTTSMSGFTQGLAIADINGNGMPEILTATTESIDNQAGGRIHVFEFDGVRGFRKLWTSERTMGAAIPAFSVADFDGDGTDDFVYNGRDVYGFDRGAGAYELRARLNDKASSAASAAGALPELREPVSAVRLVPVGLLPIRLAPSTSATVSFSLRSVWAAAEDVTLGVTSSSPLLTVSSGSTARMAVAAGGSASVSFTITAAGLPAGAQSVRGMLVLTVQASGGYHQTLPIVVTVAELTR